MAVALACLLATGLSGCGDKKKSADPPAPTASTSPSPPAAPISCEQVAKHVATAVMAEPKDAPIEGNRHRAPDETVAYNLALKRCQRSQFSQQHMQCVLAGKTSADFVACQLPP
jgi:hypothetical protein